MYDIANCKQCGKTFEQKRSDHLFCSARCVAAHYRDIPNPDMIHAAKEHHNLHYCEECGMPFYTNDYAERTGKRAPKYDSPKCKQKAYRARGKDAQQQAERRYTSNGESQANDANENEQDHARQQREHNRAEQERQDHENRERQRQRDQQYYNEYFNGQNHYSRNYGNQGQEGNHEKACRILGIQEPLNRTKVKKAYYAAMKKVHPDIYKGKDATQKAQDVNWAYEYLKM